MRLISHRLRPAPEVGIDQILEHFIVVGHRRSTGHRVNAQSTQDAVEVEGQV